MSPIEIHVGVLVALSPGAALEPLRAFADRLARDAGAVMEEATGIRWAFHPAEPTHLSTDEPRRPPGFLDAASLRMVEGPYDAVVVVTDVALVSRGERFVPGLVSSVGRIAVVSTRSFRTSPRGEPPRPLDAGAVRWNAATLLVHLLGHALGLEHGPRGAESVMSPFRIDEERRRVPPFDAGSRLRLERLAGRFPERESEDEGTLSELGFHLSSAARHPRLVVAPVIRSRAPLLPLYLPRLSTAAVAPAFLLVFTAEIWDAGFHMTDLEVWIFAALGILASTAYLAIAQNLFLPRKEKRFHTEHLAVLNVAILLVLLVAILGLFAMLGLLMISIQLFIFPPDLIREWPSLELESAVITLVDQVRIAALISAIGVLTGALAGGLESRDVLRQLVLFRRDP